jgi:hypothetical protein
VTRKQGSGKKLHNKKLHSFYSSAIIVQVMKSRTRQRAGMWHLCGRGEMHTGSWWGNRKESDKEKVYVDRKVILKLIL